MQLICDDCNDNILTFKELIKKINDVANVNEWRIEEFEAIPVNSDDWSGIGVVSDSSSQKLYEFNQRLLDNHLVILRHSEFLTFLENIRSIFYTKIYFFVSNQKCVITVLDGDIIEIYGFIETLL